MIEEEIVCGDKVLKVVLGALDVDANVVVICNGATYEGINPAVDHVVELDDDPGCATSVFDSVGELAVLVS